MRFLLALTVVCLAVPAMTGLADIAAAGPTPAERAVSAPLMQLAAGHKTCRLSRQYVYRNKFCQLEEWRNAHPACARRYC
jgi:hypothetical protein